MFVSQLRGCGETDAVNTGDFCATRSETGSLGGQHRRAATYGRVFGSSTPARLESVRSKALVLLLSTGVLASCELPTGSGSESSTIVISPSSVTLDAIEATASLTARVLDENGRVLPEVMVSWSSSNNTIARVSSAGVVTAAARGVATITATAGNTSESATVSVTPLATTLEKVSGDAQLGAAGEPLPEPLVVQASDRLGNRTAGVPVEFRIVLGDGSLSPSQVQTDSEGRAAATWTLGSLAGEEQSVRGFLSFRVGEGVEFAATAAPGPPEEVVTASGDGQAAPRLSTLSDPLVVRVEDAHQNPVQGVTVDFIVIGGQGSVQPASVNTDAAGLASTSWTLGAPVGDQSVSVSVDAVLSTTLLAVATEIPVLFDILGGDAQVGIVGERLSDQPSVRVLAAGGTPISSLDVRFSVSENGGLLEAPAGNEVGATITVRTDQSGIATVGDWILGTVPGTHNVTAEVPGLAPVVLMATAQTGPPTILTKISGDGQSAAAGTPLAISLVVEVTDAFGNPVSGTTVTFDSTPGSGSVVPAQSATDPSGMVSTQWTLDSSLGSQSVTASIAAGPSVTFDATATGTGTGLTIELQYIDQPTAAQEQAFADAIERWVDLIPGSLRPVPVRIGAGGCVAGSPAIDQMVDGVLVLIELKPIDGIVGTLGRAGICARRLSSGLPLAARLTLDIADVDRLESGGRLIDLILHELGHALGFGSLWTGKGLLANPSLGVSGADTHFTGPSAIKAFDAIGGDTYTGGQKVPVENQGGSGTRDSHWRTSVFTNELMTGFLTTGANPLSRVTVASLQDLGYQVDETRADIFQLRLPSGARVPYEEGQEPLFLGDDIYRGPVYVIDDDGRIVGVVER